MIEQVAILVNQRAGKGGAPKIADLAASRLAQKGIPCEIFVNDWPEQFDRFSDVWICGGDGTLNYFINRYPNITKPLAILGGGTGNDFRWKLYGDCNETQLLDQVMSAAPQPVDVGICNDRLFINCVGLGFDGEVLKSMDTVRKLGSWLGYNLMVVKNLLWFKEKRFVIQADSEKREGAFLIVSFCNSVRTGGNFYISPNARINDGKLNLMLIKPMANMQRLKILLSVKKGKHLSNPACSEWLNDRFEAVAEQSLFAQIDGELYTSQRFSIATAASRFYFRYHPR